ncbi:MAG: hypothetical protein U9O24_09175 [Campylobacterota bacterium]|nr:hypothetical protein [Campylobacterota bacterium]
MQVRENQVNSNNRRNNIRFDADDISLAATMLEKLSSTIEIMYYLMERGEERSFVFMLISADNADINQLLLNEKHNTDMVFEIDKEKAIYVVICQDTKIDGGYYFADRVVHHLITDNADNIYCTELEIRVSTYDIKYIIFRLLEVYKEAVRDEKEGNIIFKTLN